MKQNRHKQLLQDPEIQDLLLDYGHFVKKGFSSTLQNSSESLQQYTKQGWEILTLNDGFNDYNLSISDRPGLYTINLQYYYSLEDLLKKKDIFIKKVKRLLDDQLFSVNDLAFSPNGSKTPHLIKSLTIKQKQGTGRKLFGLEQIYVTWDNDGGGNGLNDIQKIEVKPIITEDDIELKFGDQYFPVNIKNSTFDTFFDYILDPQCDQDNARKQGILWFSTKEAAESYILYNKPCLSIQDVFRLVPGENKSLQGRFELLVKSKLYTHEAQTSQQKEGAGQSS